MRFPWFPKQPVPSALTRAVLTRRELEVLRKIGEIDEKGGYKLNKQIARELGLSLYTVKNHVGNILRKLHVPGRFDALRIAKERGLLER